MPLKSRTKMPPGGWQYFQPETGWNTPCPLSDSFDKAVQRIVDHRKNNPRFKFELSPIAVANHLETFTCHRLSHDPAWCTPDQKKTNLQESKQLSQSEPRFQSPVPARPARLRNYLSGSKILVDWLGAGGKPVSKFEAQSRANICINCPLNVKGGFMDSISGAIAGFLKAKSDLKLSVAMEEKLHTCEACSCHLPLKVWTPLNYILENMDAGTMAKLHPKCWVKKKSVKGPICILQLGRAGDVINILPIAKELADRRGHPIPIVIHEDYADILDGVSYAEPEVYQGVISDFNGALEFAKDRFEEVIETQIYGKTTFEMKHDSFCVDSWELANFGSLWGKLPLVFDQRDRAREKSLIEKHVKTKKPLLLVNFKGISSPFQYSGPVMADITQRWGNLFEILNLAGVQAERFFDLLGLMEKAAGIISIDTGTAHLASATKTPMILLQASTPHLWNGMKPSKNCELALRYPESLRRREEMHCVIDSWLPNWNQIRFCHVYSDFTSPEDYRRTAVAALTWTKVYDEHWRAIPVRDEQLPRLFRDKGRELPFVKDLIDFAAVFAADEDYIVLTNRDICFARSITSQLQKMIEVSEVGYGQRRDFEKSFNQPIDDANVKLLGVVYGGTDIFVFSRKWWVANRALMPDMLIGTEAWDAVLRHVMETFPNCVRIHDQIYHEKHKSIWFNPENRFSLPSQLHNQTLAVQFFESRKYESKVFTIR